MATHHAVLAASTIAASQYEIRSETKLAKVQVSFLALDSLVVQKSGLGVRFQAFLEAAPIHQSELDTKATVGEVSARRVTQGSWRRPPGSLTLPEI